MLCRRSSACGGPKPGKPEKPKTEKLQRPCRRKTDKEKKNSVDGNADEVPMPCAVGALRCRCDGRRAGRCGVSTVARSQTHLRSCFQVFRLLHDHTQPAAPFPPPPSTADASLPPSLRLPPDPQPHPRRRPSLSPLLPRNDDLRLPRRTPTDPLPRNLRPVFLVAKAQRREIQREQIVIRDMTARAGEAPARDRGRRGGRSAMSGGSGGVAVDDADG